MGQYIENACCDEVLGMHPRNGEGFICRAGLHTNIVLSLLGLEACLG